MGLSGNGQTELAKLIHGLQELADKRYLTQMNQSLGAETLALTKGGFDASEDPYGQAWAPVSRGGLPLRKTGRLKNAFAYVGSGEHLELLNNLPYANMMQYGTAGLPGGKLTPKTAKALAFKMPGAKGGTVFAKSVVIPGRKMVPDEGDLPPKWETRLRATADKVMEFVLKAKGA